VLRSTLDPEVFEIIAHLVEREQAVARPLRRFFVTRPLGTFGAYNLSGAGLVGDYLVAPQDLRELIDLGFIRNDGGALSVTHEGREHVHAIKRAGEPLHHLEDEVTRYLGAHGFRERHPAAHESWAHAVALRDEDPVANATRIGHDCRDAVALFVAAVEQLAGTRADVPAERTIDRVMHVLRARAGEPGEAEADLLQALVAYWRAVVRLADRQEHGAEKEGTPLDADDSRRVVLHTAIVMSEIDRALAPGA
jgi:hypothetical protein